MCAGLLGPLPLSSSMEAASEQHSTLAKLPFLAYATFAVAKSGWPHLLDPNMPPEVLFSYSPTSACGAFTYLSSRVRNKIWVKSA